MGKGAGNPGAGPGQRPPLNSRSQGAQLAAAARAFGRGRCGASGAPAPTRLDFPGSRRGSLRRASAGEPLSEVAEVAAQASGSSWFSPFFSVSAPSPAAALAPGPADMAAVLQQVLERSELNKLPKSVQNKLEKFLADQQSEIDGLKGRHEKFKVESGKWDALPALSSGPESGGLSGVLPSRARTGYDFAGSIASSLRGHPRPCLTCSSHSLVRRSLFIRLFL